MNFVGNMKKAHSPSLLMNNHYFYCVDRREEIFTGGEVKRKVKLEVHHRWKNMECENEKNEKRGVNGGNLPRNPQKYL